MEKPEFITEFTSDRRQLPHLLEPGATYFVGLCLIRPARLDLTDEPIGQVVLAAIKHHDGTKYHLFDYTVMPDHVHMILQPRSAGGRTYHLERVLQDLKRWTARQINRLTSTRGELWQVEGFDHIIRS